MVACVKARPHGCPMVASSHYVEGRLCVCTPFPWRPSYWIWFCPNINNSPWLLIFNGWIVACVFRWLNCCLCVCSSSGLLLLFGYMVALMCTLSPCLLPLTGDGHLVSFSWLLPVGVVGIRLCVHAPTPLAASSYWSHHSMCALPPGCFFLLAYCLLLFTHFLLSNFFF